MGNWFKRLSLRQRLPLLVGVLLLGTVITFSWISYIGIENVVMKTGKARLINLAGQLGSMYSQGAQTILANTRVAAAQAPVIKYIQGDTAMGAQARETLKKLQPDSSWVLTVLTGPGRRAVLRSENNSISTRVNFDSLWQLSAPGDSAMVGKLYFLGGSIYYFITAPVVDQKQVIGYLVRWRLQVANTKSIEQVSKLMGTNAGLFVGNKDGSLWTDLIQPVSLRPLGTTDLHEPFEYTDGQGKKVIAAAQPIPHTPWVVSVSFPKQIVLETANRFLQWVVLLGIVLIAVGLFAGWLMSRSITRPLNKLRAAALAVTGGDYSSPVEVDRNDELGTLAAAFNSMVVQVRNAKEGLEQKVTERTAQLEMANKELESFSYSVSHDLRAPLRAIIGFTSILSEDHADRLDEEGKRITGVIKRNTLKMGHLIDDLLAFSRMARQDIKKTAIHTDEMVAGVINELTGGNRTGNIEWIVQPLPEAEGDINIIRQVWVNLISNAIKYSKKCERPRIEIGTFDRGGQTVFFIKDNGVGFDELYKHKLFNVFQRLHSDEEFEGTGIGLALVEKIISRHGGMVWAESVVDKGATFYFSLPK